MAEENSIKILVVDDVEASRFMLRDIIKDCGYIPVMTENGAQALRFLDRAVVDLVLLDVTMPDMSGFEVCRRIKADVRTREIPIIFISALENTEHIKQGFVCGGADYISKPFVSEIVKSRINLHVKLYRSGKQLQDMNRKLQISVMEQMRRVEKEKKNVLYALLQVAKENAAFDEAHMDRISKNCRTLTEALQLTNEYSGYISDDYVDTISLAAPLCDIGNVAVPTEILQKKDKLTDDEIAIMQRHVLVGTRILDGISDDSDDNDFMKMTREIVAFHHENWNGSGYPNKTKGDDIPLSAQIVHIISTYCALTEIRSYRDAFSKDDALSLMEKVSGEKYNPDLVNVLLLIRRQLA